MRSDIAPGGTFPDYGLPDHTDGRVAYEPGPLEAPATGNLLLCCSRPESDLTLDL